MNELTEEVLSAKADVFVASCLRKQNSRLFREGHAWAWASFRREMGLEISALNALVDLRIAEANMAIAAEGVLHG